MRTMRDEIFDRDYQAGRAELHAGIDRAVATIGRSLGDMLEGASPHPVDCAVADQDRPDAPDVRDPTS